MNRRELLLRLQQLNDAGQDMDLPIVVRINTKVPDRRRIDGYRREHQFADLSN